MIVVFASGKGSNFETLYHALCKHDTFSVICNIATAPVIEKCHTLGVSCYVVPNADYKNRKDHEQAIVRCLASMERKNAITLVILAGYMRILSAHFFSEFKELFGNTNTPSIHIPKILNLHPADPGIYKGSSGLEFAFKSKFPFWTSCLHEVVPQVDSGVVLKSETIKLFPYESEIEFKNRFQRFENEFFVKNVVALVSSDPFYKLLQTQR